MEEEELYLGFDPDTNEILGVFKDLIHIKGHNCVLLIPEKEYFRILKIWIKGKRNHCELYGHYCGVMGTTQAVDYEKLDFQIDINEVIDDDTEEDGCRIETRMVDAYLVRKFEDICDFEHG